MRLTNGVGLHHRRLIVSTPRESKHEIAYQQATTDRYEHDSEQEWSTRERWRLTPDEVREPVVDRVKADRQLTV